MRGFYKICSIVVFTALLTGCGADKAIKKAEKFYALGEYYDAAAQYKKAYAQTPPKEKEKRGELSQKLATCYFEQGFASLGHQFLQQASNRRTDRMPGVYETLLVFTRLRYIENDRSSPEYEGLLRDLYENGGEALGDSYKRIFADYLIELYMAQRKYKDALAIKSEYGYV